MASKPRKKRTVYIRDKNGRFKFLGGHKKKGPRDRKPITKSELARAKKALQAAVDAKFRRNIVESKRVVADQEGFKGTDTKKLGELGELLARLAPRLPKAKKRLITKALMDRVSELPTAPEPPTAPTTSKPPRDLNKPKATRKTSVSDGEQEAKKKEDQKKNKLANVRTPVSADSVTLENGTIQVWKDKPEYAKADKSWKVRYNKNFAYEIDGTTFNRNQNEYRYKGEIVQGMPSLNPRLREMSNKDLFNVLGIHMTYVENGKRVKAPAPYWNPGIHGQIEGARQKSVYGQIQIHHVDQWSKVPFRQITDRLDRGEITLDQAKDEFRAITQIEQRKNKKGEVKDHYVIDVAPQGQRKLVALPGNYHDLKDRSFYLKHHPLGVHPETGKIAELGIPQKGNDAASGSRDYFTAWSKGFWAEVHRREVYVVRQELDRRMRKGEISPDEAKGLWAESQAKAVKRQKDAIRSIEREFS